MHSIKLLLISVVLFFPSFTKAAGDEVAFFYGPNPPANLLSQFGRIVVEPDNVTADENKALQQHGAATFAYISIGEIGPTRSWYHTLSDTAVLGTNSGWNSKVMDMSSTEWQRFLLQRVNELVARGYNGLFLDTMDSYQLFANTPSQLQQQQQGLSNLLNRIKRRHPQIRMIANRGFEVIDQIAPHLEAVAAESLYAGWNNASESYVDVPLQDRQWLTNTLDRIKLQHKLDIISIDYVPPSQRNRAREVAAKINEHGYIPWVANPALDYVGISNLEAIPRDVLMLFDSSITGPLRMSEVFSLLAMPLEYMGYVPAYHDLAEQPLPAGTLSGRYAGVVMWNRTNVKNANYREWLIRHLRDQVPMAFFGSVGVNVDNEITSLLGIQNVPAVDADSLSVKSKDTMLDFELDIPPRISGLGMGIINADSANTSHLRFTDKNNKEIDTVITGPWGGLAISPTIIELRIDGTPEWIINPFSFLKKSLRLMNAPMPDVTTENGNRLWLAHIDGDALPSWAELPGRRLGAEVLYDEILTKYDLPHTISIVEAEMNNIDEYIDRRARMVDIVRRTFELDNVELASHTHSHPFKWNQLKFGDFSGKYNLPVKNYRYDPARELVGSIDFINRHLAPPHKTANIILWSGDAFPPAEALAVAHKHGFLNMNGGNTRISKYSPSVASISPNARIVGGYTQVYAPIINENVYTNDWTGPYDGYRDVLQTFTMTEYPRRIKPINLYYHNYIGTKAASLRSLKEVYQWSAKQQIFPVFASEYIVKVPEFRSATIGRYLDGRWKVSGLGSIRSLRVLNNKVWPDLSTTRTIIGAKQLHDGTYIHTNGANTVSFHTSAKQPRQPHLVTSNASVKRWVTSSRGRISFRLSGHAPVTLELSGDNRFCSLRQRNIAIKGELTEQGNTRYQFLTKDTGNAVIDCQT